VIPTDVDVVRAATLAEAVDALRDRPERRPLAGGTDLIVLLHQGLITVDAVLDLGPCDELRTIERTDDGLTLGAMVTHTATALSPDVRGWCPTLADAASRLGSRQIQNHGTLGGNLGNASPAGDTLPVLLASRATVHLAGPDGQRDVPMDELYTGYRELCLTPGEIIRAVTIPKSTAEARFWFAKVGSRRAFYCSKVVLAATGEVADGAFRNLSIGGGSVMPTVVRLKAAEQAAEGQDANDPAVWDAAADAAMAEIEPITDVRSTAEYRLTVVGRLIRRFLSDLADDTLPGAMIL